ncbi:hypothetical protein SDC9_41291 [bioreactor metagenome]|uniref:Uncharacterized protein n=1 Tax=bioreactor metagenome TaxID=1076179 RepID=A0A644VUL5_9ZZZZ
MGAEEAVFPLLFLEEGVHDVEVLHPLACPLQLGGVGSEFLQGGDEPCRVPCQFHGRGVGQVFPLAAHRELDEGRQKGGDNGQDDGNDGEDCLGLPAAPGIAAPPSAAEGTVEQAPPDHIGQEDNGPHHHRHEHGEPDVIVPHVGHLVGHDSLELFPVQLFQKPPGDGHAGVLGVPPGGEGVHGLVLDEVHLRHGHPSCDGKLLHHVPELGGLVVGDLLRAARSQDHGSAEPPGDEEVQPRHSHGDDHSREPVAAPVGSEGGPEKGEKDGHDPEEEDAHVLVVVDQLVEACHDLSPLPEGNVDGVPLGSVVHRPERPGAIAKFPRNKVVGENGNGDVVLLHRIVIVLAGEGDLVLRGGELFLEGEEILVGLQVGVVFRHGQKGLERPGELVLQRGGFFHRGGGEGSTPQGGDPFEYLPFMSSVGLHRLHQVGDEVVPPLELHVDLAPAVIGVGLPADKGVVDVHGIKYCRRKKSKQDIKNVLQGNPSFTGQ